MAINYFRTLVEALDTAIDRATERGAEFDPNELSNFLDRWNGGVSYGQTVTHACPVFKLKGKLQRARAMTVVLYRVESGNYELVTYIN